MFDFDDDMHVLQTFGDDGCADEPEPGDDEPQGPPAPVMPRLERARARFVAPRRATSPVVVGPQHPYSSARLALRCAAAEVRELGVQDRATAESIARRHVAAISYERDRDEAESEIARSLDRVVKWQRGMAALAITRASRVVARRGEW